MGIGRAARDLYQMLALQPCIICDIGSQDIHLTESGISCREWMEKKGFEYSCIDFDGRHGAMKLDLNVAVASDVGKTFDVVTNHGTTEHVFNQFQAFKLIHDITNVGGLMIHAVPTPRFDRPHGFYFYDECIFKDLAFANSYSITHMYREYDPHEIILVVMKKNTHLPFKMPIQRNVSVSTNDISNAILALLKTATFNLYAGNNLTFVTARRRFLKWDQVEASQMPALFLWEPGESFDWKALPLAKNEQRFEAIIYLQAPADQTLDPISDIDAVKDAIFNILKPTVSGRMLGGGAQTLGGIVEYCRIQGEVVKASGDLDNISLLIIPIRVLLGAPIA